MVIWSMASAAMAVRPCPCAEVPNITHLPPWNFFLHFIPHSQAPELSNNFIKSHKFLNLHFTPKDSKKPSFWPLSTKIKNLHLSLNICFDCKPFCFNSKSLMGFPNHKIIGSRGFCWLPENPLPSFGLSGYNLAVPKIIPDLVSLGIINPVLRRSSMPYPYP